MKGAGNEARISSLRTLLLTFNPFDGCFGAGVMGVVGDVGRVGVEGVFGV